MLLEMKYFSSNMIKRYDVRKITLYIINHIYIFILKANSLPVIRYLCLSIKYFKETLNFYTN